MSVHYIVDNGHYVVKTVEGKSVLVNWQKVAHVIKKGFSWGGAMIIDLVNSLK